MFVLLQLSLTLHIKTCGQPKLAHKLTQADSTCQAQNVLRAKVNKQLVKGVKHLENHNADIFSRVLRDQTRGKGGEIIGLGNRWEKKSLLYFCRIFYG